MALYKYKPQGVCSKQYDIEVEDGIIKNMVVHGGCSGNTQGVCALARGMEAQKFIDLCKGIKCGPRPTSCPDQIARALEAILEQQ